MGKLLKSKRMINIKFRQGTPSGDGDGGSWNWKGQWGPSTLLITFNLVDCWVGR